MENKTLTDEIYAELVGGLKTGLGHSVQYTELLALPSPSLFSNHG